LYGAMGIMMLVTCDTGFENILAEELGELAAIGLRGISSGRIFVEVYRYEDLANVFRSRIANNIYILVQVEENVVHLDDIYRFVKSIDFAKFIEPWQTFAIRPERIGKHDFTSIDIGRVAGQAVIDSYLESRGHRLKVNLDNPDVEIYVELNVDRLIVAVSLTRSSLHLRGYKLFAHPAGLKPTIACALLRFAGWRRDKPLVDPMCGGGTIPIEAALASKGVEIPCISMDRIDVRTLYRLYPEAGEALHNLCRNSMLNEFDRIFVGIDINPRFVEGAIVNAKNAGVDDATLFLVGDFRGSIPKLKRIENEIGVVFDTAVFNPPYGYRMKPRKLRELYEDMLKILIDNGFRRIVFITSATRVSEKVLESLRGIEVQKLKVIHGTLPSYVYRLEI